MQSQTDVKDARIPFGRLLTTKLIQEAGRDIQRRIWLDGFQTAANAIRRGHDRWKLGGKPDSRFKARLARNIARVRIEELQCRNCGPQDIDGIRFARELLHQSNELRGYSVRRS